MPTLRNRRGFALPMAILVIVVLATTLAVSLSVSSSETSTNLTVRGQNRAFAVAQAGLEQYVLRRNEIAFWQQYGVGGNPSYASRTTVPDLDAITTETLTVKVSGGLATIRARKIRPELSSTQPALYFITSTGRDTVTKGSGKAYGMQPTRTVGMYAVWNTNVLNVMASWLSLTGLVKNGTGTISGVDMCGKKADKAGVLTPSGELKVQGNSSYFGGTPPVDTSHTQAQLKATAGIDWNAIKNNNSITADFVVPPSSFPTAAWFMADTNRFPIIRIENSGGSEFSLPNVGRGMLIVEGDLSISGDNMWSGVILVGGKLTSNGKNVVAGATLSGLDALLPNYTPCNSNSCKSQSGDDATANGNKSYIYNSCSVDKATKGMQSYRPMPNTWVDNVPTW